MATYITQADIENKFGTNNVQKWSQLDEESEDVDAARITAAIAYGCEVVENMMRDGRYAVPFLGSCVELKDWCATFAGIWLFMSRGTGAPATADDAQRFNGMALRAEQDIKSAMTGGKKLPLAMAHPTASVPTLVPAAPGSTYFQGGPSWRP